MNRKLLVIFLSLSIAIFGCGLIYGMVSVEVTNNFETGIVDIRIKEYQKVEDKEIPWEDNPTVLPGDAISKIPRIFNDGNDCYVRVKLSFRDACGLSESDLFGISDSWVKADDGYYYYKNILNSGDMVDIFKGLQIPEDFSQEHEGKKLYIDIDADAVQSRNFTPDYTLAKPWGDVEILACGKEGMYDLSTFKKADSQSFSITYQGDVKKLFKNTDDFFVNFPFLMPGDTYTDTLKLENDADRNIRLYFRTADNDTSDILDKIQLKITTKINGKTEVFYEGDLRAKVLNNNVVLGVIPKNSNGEFKFEIFVPHELNNKYSINSSAVQWIFSTTEIAEPKAPKTGDNSNVVLWASVLGLSLSGMSLILLAKKKEGEEKC